MTKMKEREAGLNANDQPQETRNSEQSIYRRLAKDKGLDGSEAQQLILLEEENSRLKRMVVELSLDKQMLEEALSGKW